MSTSKHIERICIAAAALTLALTLLLMWLVTPETVSAVRAMKYEHTLFDTSYVHQIDIVMDDWDSFIEGCESEEYSVCTVVIDGNSHKNTAIRAKGNTSLSNVRSLGSQRYSFKLEFDHYESGGSYDGLDKLCLNNLIQDNTMIKDYLAYQMMGDFGVDAPLSSFAYITVNGEDWGLYLAVEGVEDSFLSRNYGSDTGELYKPDSMSFGGGRGNGRDFRMDEFDFDGSNQKNQSERAEGEAEKSTLPDGVPQMQAGMTPPDGVPQMPDGMTPPDGMPQMQDGTTPPDGMPQMRDTIPQAPTKNERAETSQTSEEERRQGNRPQMPDEKGGGMGSDDVKLKYIDDDPNSYQNIFDSAKTELTAADKARLLSSLKSLSNYSDLENVLDMEEVLRYFVVHNFLCNGDSYTGSMIHNYYLHEKDGRLGMIPWDYNLAFGTFQGGNGADTVNASIDSPVSGGDVNDRPMVGWIFSDEVYTKHYHQLFSELIERWFTNGELSSMIASTAEMLRPYVEKDPTKFCTVEEFDAGVTAISDFTSLRGEAVRRQLSGDDTAVDTTGLNLSDMGTMNQGGGMNRDFDGSAMPTRPEAGQQKW